MPELGRYLNSATIKARRWLLTPISLLEKACYQQGVFSARALNLPDFLGIGAQKSGTTWLHENLCHHPQLFLPERKELHYFDWNYQQPLRGYSQHFLSANGYVKGEITPNYCTIPKERIAFLHHLLPDLRLIFLMRNPIERAWSQAAMNLLKKTDRSLEEVPDAEFIAHFHSVRSLSRGDYLANLDRWLQFYPETQLFCGFFEDISVRPQALLTDIFEFLGVSKEVNWHTFPYSKVIFQGASAEMPDRFRTVLEQLYRDDIEQLYERFGDPVQAWRVN